MSRASNNSLFVTSTTTIAEIMQSTNRVNRIKPFEKIETIRIHRKIKKITDYFFASS